MNTLHYELSPTCPECESNNILPVGNGDEYCNSCHTTIDPFTWESISEEVFPEDIETAKEVH